MVLHRALNNLRNVIDAAGGTTPDLASVRVYISTEGAWAELTPSMVSSLQRLSPRTTIPAELGMGVKVEIDGSQSA